MTCLVTGPMMVSHVGMKLPRTQFGAAYRPGSPLMSTTAQRSIGLLVDGPPALSPISLSGSGFLRLRTAPILRTQEHSAACQTLLETQRGSGWEEYLKLFRYASLCRSADGALRQCLARQFGEPAPLPETHHLRRGWHLPEASTLPSSRRSSATRSSYRPAASLACPASSSRRSLEPSFA